MPIIKKVISFFFVTGDDWGGGEGSVDRVGCP